MTILDRPGLVARSEGDVLHAVPSLLGFHPHDSVVVMLATPVAGVILTARADLDVCRRLDDPSQVMQPALRHVAGRRDLGAIVVGYGSDRDDVARIVGAMLTQLPALAIFGAVVVEDRWWFHDDGPYDPGRHHDPLGGPFVAETIYQGHSVLASRADVVAGLDPVGGRPPRGSGRAVERAITTLAGLAPAAQASQMAGLLDRRLRSPHLTATLDECALLVALSRLPVAREEFWLRLCGPTSRVLLAMWLEVVRIAPRRRSVPVLCLMGMAAWQAGEGVLLTTGLERAADISPRHELVKLLGAVSENMLPPSLWEQMRGDGGEA